MRRLLLSLAISLAGLLLAEGVTRLLTAGSRTFDRPFFAGGNHPRFLFVPDAETHYALRPGFQGRDRCVDFDVPVAISAAGLRDRDRARLPEGRFRVLAVGDSFTYGEGVPIEESYLALLEKDLRREIPGADVIKAGVPGFGLTQMVSRARRLLPVYSPDLLLVGLFHSELSRDTDPYIYKDGFIVRSSTAEHLDLVAGNLWYSTFEPGWQRWLQVHLIGYSRLARWLMMTLTPRPAKGPVVPLRRPTAERLARRLEEELAAPEKQLAELAKECAARRCALLVLLIPEKREDWRRVPNSHDLADALLAWGREAGIRFVDLKETLGRFWNDRQSFYYAHDAHWNAAGHRRVAEALSRVLEGAAAAPKGPVRDEGGER